MSLTSGKGPLSASPSGRFDFDRPATVVYVEPLDRRVRGRIGGRTVIDTWAALLVHRTGLAPTYALPVADVDVATAIPEPAAPGHVRVPWEDVEEWFEEDEQVFLHAVNPYHRVDVFTTSRRIHVSRGTTRLADTNQALALYETALPTRYYLSRDDIRMDLLEPSPTTSFCPYKGTASYWSLRLDGHLVPDVAWSYDDPIKESEQVASRLCFYGHKVTITVTHA